MDDCTFDEQTAASWISAVEVPGRSFRDEFIYPKIRKLADGADRVLDIGCGQGICSQHVECEYVGVEPSSFLVDRARTLYPGKAFLPGNAYSLPVANQTFDAAFSILVWHLLRDIENAVFEMSRALRSGGRFLVVTANPDSYAEWINFYPDAKIDGKRMEGTMQLGEFSSRDVLYLHSMLELKAALQSAGLRIEREETFLTPAKLLVSIEGRKI